MLSPDSLEGPHATGGLDVADHANGDHGRGLDDGGSLDNLLLVVLGAGPVHLAHDVGHAGLEYTHSEMKAARNIIQFRTVLHQFKLLVFQHCNQRWIFGSSGDKSLLTIAFDPISKYPPDLVAHEAGEVDRLAGVILGEGLGLAAVPLGPLLGQESLGPVTGSFEFPVRHGGRPTWCLQQEKFFIILAF